MSLQKRHWLWRLGGAREIALAGLFWVGVAGPAAAEQIRNLTLAQALALVADRSPEPATAAA